MKEEEKKVFPDSMERIANCKEFWITKHRNVWDRADSAEILDVRVLLTEPADKKNWLHVRVVEAS